MPDRSLAAPRGPFRISREELEHLDLLHRLVAEALIKTGEIVLEDM